MKNVQKKLICVVGATASGKTGLGVALAKKFDGEIISADSRQVYRRLDIGTGKEGGPAQSAGISKSEFLISNQISNFNFQNPNKFQIWNSKPFIDKTIQLLNNSLRFIDEIPQWLIDICEPEEEFSMFDWLELARCVLDDIWARGKIPIVVGGTGLYVQALVQGFSLEQVKSQKSKVKSLSREELEEFDLDKLQRIAKKLNPKAYELIDMNNPRRLIRFIERMQAGEMPEKVKPDFEYLLVGIDLPRDELYAKIDRRVDEWFEQGFYEEVEELLKSGVKLEWLNKIGLEYRILSEFISKIKNQKSKNQIKNKNSEYKDFVEMKQMMKFAIHQYARRQLTWWRRFEVKWVSDAKSAEKAVQKFLIVDK